VGEGDGDGDGVGAGELTGGGVPAAGGAGGLLSAMLLPPPHAASTSPNSETSDACVFKACSQWSRRHSDGVRFAPMSPPREAMLRPR
jgi:hypothetical protein